MRYGQEKSVQERIIPNGPRIVQMCNDVENGLTVVLTEDGRLWQYRFSITQDPGEWLEEWKLPFVAAPSTP